LYGVTALVLAPENTMIDHLVPKKEMKEVASYRKTTLAKTAVQRQK
jgi:leucyl-tRNA synthetase